MALLEAQPVLATTNVFQHGDIECQPLHVDPSSTSSPPKPLLIFTPIVAAKYPVILFCHGFCLATSGYSNLFNHIASHGYVVVAPQFCLNCEWMPMMSYCEVKCAGDVADWVAEKLQSVLPENVIPNLDQFVTAGHSKGGNTAFAVALGHAKTKLNISALVGVDPVGGLNKYCKTYPWILKGQAGSFKLTMPVAIIGTGLGPEKADYCCSQPCAPEGVNHENFFFESNPPCAYFVAKEYGHMDMLDDSLGVIGKVASCLCKNGTGAKDCMRRTVGGLIVAFLRAHLDLRTHDLDAIVANPSLAPATLHPAKYIKAP
ncbi:chlorophyllase-1-like [Prosopis cineraria]|uniref:chlorophyllase-1-like n=1 Tax=Prosopis cineraria TaxID=364024 RepID=UPI00240EF779|nr:chlorophyllase-1-like [Prosopis cineraria]